MQHGIPAMVRCGGNTAYILVYVMVKNSGHTCTVPLKSAVSCHFLTCLILSLIQNQSKLSYVNLSDY